ncbi:hypothetical protein C8J56DRAFT_1109702 [Mycena floridula]|nr:hypothetical protein C8J56DRAFT_1109702 [Mycena floridula]
MGGIHPESTFLVMQMLTKKAAASAAFFTQGATVRGNSLENAQPSSILDFVKANGGHTVITKVLIANNGIAAVKEFTLSANGATRPFGREREIEFNAMATPEDLKVNAEYIRMADRYIEVPGGSNNNNYANVELIVDVAERTDVHAVWAGWGHASENPRLPESLAASKNKIISSTYHAVAEEILGSLIFIVKLAGSARHLEVQLLADQYGNAVSLFRRDCSVQRRHQKIIEEAPVTIAKEETFEKMERATVRLAKLVGYVSAGTAEYLYSHSEDYFYFLELNLRLQVEHPTTKMISGVNLPATRFHVAMGIPLRRIRNIRQLYGIAPNASSEFVFDPDANRLQRRPRPKGHVIHVVAVRITAENPDAGFKPSSGSLQELNFRSSTNVWGYFPLSTSEFGHIFAYGEDRGESRKNMIIVLKELGIHSDFRTTVEYLIKHLELEAFKNNTITTGWLDSLISDKLTAERPDATLAIICGAVTKAYLASNACWTEYKRILDKGQVPTRDVFGIDDGGSETSCRQWTSGVARWKVPSTGEKKLELYGRCENFSIDQENDPTQLRSPSPGKLIRFFVDSGEHINAGEQYAEIEVMKMIVPLVASEDSIVQSVKGPGVSLEPDILSIRTLEDGDRVEHAKPFEGLLAPMGSLVSPPTSLTDVSFDASASWTMTDTTILLLWLRLSRSSSRFSTTRTFRILKSLAQEFPAVQIKKLLDNHVQDRIVPCSDPGLRLFSMS